MRSHEGPHSALDRPLRSGVARALWGLLATALLCGALICFISLGMLHLNPDDFVGTLAAAFAMLAVEIFPLSKLTRYRRTGFYRETLRPFLISICLAAVGIAAAVLGAMRLGEDETLAAIGVVVVGLVFALFFMLLRGSNEPAAASITGQPANMDRSSRGNVARALWGLVASSLLCGALMCFVSLGMLHLGPDEFAGTLAAAFAMLAVEILPLSKLTRHRRAGFYRETLRPFLISICLAAVGIAVAVLGGMRLNEEETLMAVGFIVGGLVFALFFTLVRGANRSPAAAASDPELRSRSRRRAAAISIAVGVGFVAVGLALMAARTATYSRSVGHGHYSSSWGGGSYPSREKAIEQCAERVASYMQEWNLVDWTPGRPFTLVVNHVTGMDQTPREEWTSALLASLRTRYPYSEPNNFRVTWERRQTAVGAHWTGEGVNEDEVVLDLREQRKDSSQITLNGRLLAKARGGLYSATMTCTYRDTASRTRQEAATGK